MEDPGPFHGWNPEAGAVGNYASNNSAIPWRGKSTSSFLHSVRNTRNLLLSCEDGSLHGVGPLLHIMNIVFMMFVLVSMSIDHIFLYVPLVNDDKKCIELDKRLGITAVVIRSVIDLFYGCYFTSKFRRFSKWSCLYLIYILAILPLPQVITLSHLPEIIVSKSFNIIDLLKFVILFQYLPRIYMTYPLLNKVTEATTKFVRPTKVRWIRAAVYFSIYMVVSHVFGAFWYLFSIGRVTRCWQTACTNFPGCVRQSVYCDIHSENNTYLIDACPIESPNASIFNFGIYLDALQSGVVSSKDFPAKLSYCFWWGLRNLSSLGQNLQTSTYFWENCFAVVISIFGSGVFLLFIGKVQIYLQSKTMRLEEKRLRLEEARLEEENKRKEKPNQIENWLTSHALTHDLKVSIRQHLINEWFYSGGADLLVSTKEVNLENVLHHLTLDLRKKMIHFLIRRLLIKFPLSNDAAEEILDELCHHLKPVVVKKDYCFVREGTPLNKMIFVVQGTLNMTRMGEMNGYSLSKGSIYGENLITWLLDSPYSTDLPVSDKTVQASDSVEAFVLMADDLKNIILEFWWFFSKKLDYSSKQKWQPVAASVIKKCARHWLGKKASLKSTSKEKEKESTVFDMLPPNLRQQIKMCLQSSLKELSIYDVGTLLQKLPMDLNRAVKCHLCLGPLKNVPLFMNKDGKWLHQLCDYLRPVHYTDRSHIIRERDPIVEMVFFVRGKLWGYSTSEAKNKYFSDGYCYGEELVKWAEAGSQAKLPTATIAIQACSDVQAFVLLAAELKLLVGQQHMGIIPFTIKDEESPSKIINDSLAESKFKEIESDAEQNP